MDELMKDILTAEARLQVELPQAYKDFILAYGDPRSYGDGPRGLGTLRTLSQEAVELELDDEEDLEYGYLFPGIRGEIRDRLVRVDDDGAGNGGAMLFPLDGAEAPVVVELWNGSQDDLMTEADMLADESTLSLDAWLAWAIRRAKNEREEDGSWARKWPDPQ